MTTVLKFPLQDFHNLVQRITLPADAIVLSVGCQNGGDLKLWVSTDTKNSDVVVRKFVCLFTGVAYSGDGQLTSLGRVTTGPIEWHIFEVKG